MYRLTNRPARDTGRREKFSDKTVYGVFDDGSYRRIPARLRGKAAVKAAKRARHK